jgi:hypothetical protein
MSQITRSDSPETPPSSGAQTPTSTSGSGPSSAYSSYISSMWGLIRRFSSEDSQFPSQMDASNGFDHHQAPKDGIHGVFNPVKRTASPFRPPPLDPLVLQGYKSNTPDTARLLSRTVAEEIRAMVPERLRIVDDWSLVYSLEQDGASLATLYQRCLQFQAKRVGFVLVVRDQEGAVRIHSVVCPS